MKYLIILLKYIMLIAAILFLYPSIVHTSLVYEDELCDAPTLDSIKDIQLISLDQNINLYGQIIEECEEASPLPDIRIEVENTNISCITGMEGDFMLRNVPIKKQKLNFYDAEGEYIAGVEVCFHIDGGDICLCSMEQMILDVGNSDGRVFKNMQIGFTIDSENRTLSYNMDNIRGNVESPENRILYALICVLFLFIFLSVMILVDKKATKR